jgi:hypothetical protein
MAYTHQQTSPEHLNSEESRLWIDAHMESKVQSLRMKYGLKEPYFSRIAQIEVRQKKSKKFPSLIQSSWVFPTGIPLEQASSEAAALYKAALIHTPYVADLCAGSGIDCWAITRREGHKELFAVEADEALSGLLEHNLQSTTVIRGLAEEALVELDLWQTKLDVKEGNLTVYLDPDRRVSSQKTFALEDASPNIVTLQHELFKRAKFIITKHSPMIDLGELHKLVGLRAVHVVQSGGENKEILALQELGFEGKVEVVAVELVTGENTSSINESFKTDYTSEVKAYIIQPGPALAKSGLHAKLAEFYHWEKLPYGMLYTSLTPPLLNDLFKSYRVIEQANPYKLKFTVSHAAVEGIGFPEKPEIIRKRLKIKEGDKHKIFAVKSGNNKLMILTERLA